MNVLLVTAIAEFDVAIFFAANIACFIAGIALGVSVQTWRCRHRRGRST